jgi:hypothetical protein
MVIIRDQYNLAAGDTAHHCSFRLKFYMPLLKNTETSFYNIADNDLCSSPNRVYHKHQK